MITFASLIDGPSRGNVESMIHSALDTIVGLLLDKHERVKIAAASTLNRISETFPLSILNHPNFPKICQVLAVSINAKPKVNIYNFPNIFKAFSIIGLQTHGLVI